MLKIIVVGAGAAGYFAAAAIKRNCPDTEVTIVYDPNTPYIGVGEGISWHSRGIMKDLFGFANEFDQDWMAKSRSSYKHCTSYVGFDGTDTPLITPHFWNPDASIVTRSIIELASNGYRHQDSHLSQYSLFDLWLHLYNKGLRPKSSRMADLTEAFWYVHHNTIPDPKNTFQDRWWPSFHFNADYIKDVIHELVGIPNGVKTMAKKIKQVNFDGEKIQSLTCEDDGRITADLFIDCTGFKRFIASQLPFKWQPAGDHFNNSAVVGQGPNSNGTVNPSSCRTEHYAMDHGWVFSLPQPGRSGNGYLFNSKMTGSADAVVDEFNQKFPSKANAIKKLMTWDPGFYKDTFVANCITLGISSGFVDVFDANNFSAGLVFIERLVEFIKHDQDNSFAWRDQYNNFVNNINNDVLFRIQTGLMLALKNDTVYWQDLGQMAKDLKLKEQLQEAILGDARRKNAKCRDVFWLQPAMGTQALNYNIELPLQLDIDSKTEQLAMNYFDWFSRKNQLQAQYSTPVNEWYNKMYPIG
jgi:hypothetical protein